MLHGISYDPDIGFKIQSGIIISDVPVIAVVTEEFTEYYPSIAGLCFLLNKQLNEVVANQS